MARLLSVIAFVQTLFQTTSGTAFPAYQHQQLGRDSEYFDWFSIQASRDLTYHDCYDHLKCARLLVPLDWQAQDPSRWDKSIALAVIKKPAKVPITDPTYGGAIITNPGGPGGSGVSMVLGMGSPLQLAFDSPSKHFDIVSFDPRGVLFSEPLADCFANPVKRDAWNLRVTDEGLPDGGTRDFHLQWARSKALGSLCANSGVGRYISTASVARDILELIDQIEKHRQAELAILRAATNLNNGRQALLATEGSSGKSPGMLQYYGASYGTVLGATFASLFPDRVKRMILDGVVDSRDWVLQGWKANLQDTDRVMKSFYEYCFAAGPRCALFDAAGPEIIEQSTNSFLEALRMEPIVGEDSLGVLNPDIVTYSIVKQLIFGALYQPVIGFPLLASLLDRMRNGKYDEILRVINFMSSVSCPNNSTARIPTYPGEATKAIICVDGDDVSNMTTREFEEHLSFLKSQSSTGGSLLATIRLGCTGWQVRPNWRFTGPFGGNTSTPILWLGNTADPITPIRNARNMSELFPGSAVLQHDSGGHCALSNYPSECTLHTIRKYLSHGQVPETGTICPPAQRPFDDMRQETNSTLSVGDCKEETTLQNMFQEDLHKAMQRMHMPLHF